MLAGPARDRLAHAGMSAAKIQTRCSNIDLVHRGTPSLRGGKG